MYGSCTVSSLMSDQSFPPWAPRSSGSCNEEWIRMYYSQNLSHCRSNEGFQGYLPENSGWKLSETLQIIPPELSNACSSQTHKQTNYYSWYVGFIHLFSWRVFTDSNFTLSTHWSPSLKTHQIHNPTTLNGSGGQVVTCNFTTLSDDHW